MKYRFSIGASVTRGQRVGTVAEQTRHSTRNGDIAIHTPAYIVAWSDGRRQLEREGDLERSPNA